MSETPRETTAAPRTVIYGGSDDLLEVRSSQLGDEEYQNDISGGCWISTSAGHLIRCTGDSDGLWGFRVIADGGWPDLMEILPARGDGEPDDAEGCPGYSAKVVISGDLSWVLVSEQKPLVRS